VSSYLKIGGGKRNLNESTIQSSLFFWEERRKKEGARDWEEEKLERISTDHSLEKRRRTWEFQRRKENYLLAKTLLFDGGKEKK